MPVRWRRKIIFAGTMLGLATAQNQRNTTIGMDNHQIQFTGRDWSVGRGNRPCSQNQLVASTNVPNATLALQFSDLGNILYIFGALQPGGAKMALIFDNLTETIDTSRTTQNADGCDLIATIRGFEGLNNIPHSLEIRNEGPGLLTLNNFQVGFSNDDNDPPTPTIVSSAVVDPVTLPSKPIDVATLAKSTAVLTASSKPSPSIVDNPTQANKENTGSSVQKSKMNGGVIAGVISSVLVIFFFLLAVFIYRRKRQRRLSNGTWSKNFFKEKTIHMSLPTDHRWTSSVYITNDRFKMEPFDLEKLPYAPSNLTTFAPAAPPSAPALALAIPPSARLEETSPTSATVIPSRRTHRKPVPSQVPKDVDSFPGSPTSPSPPHSPLEPPPALRPRNGSMSSPRFTNTHLLWPASPANSEFLQYSEVTGRQVVALAQAKTVVL